MARRPSPAERAEQRWALEQLGSAVLVSTRRWHLPVQRTFAILAIEDRIGDRAAR